MECQSAAAADARHVRDLEGAHELWPGWRLSLEGADMVASRQPMAERAVQERDGVRDTIVYANASTSAAAIHAFPGHGIGPKTVADVPLVAPFAEHWPLRSFLELGPMLGAVPCARLHARQVLWEWGLTAFSESTELLVSELITNAVRISRAIAQGTPVRLWLVSDRAQVVILAWDASSLPPVPSDADDKAETGRGLLIVQAVSERWGWDFPPGMGGKIVWAQARPE